MDAQRTTPSNAVYHFCSRSWTTEWAAGYAQGSFFSQRKNLLVLTIPHGRPYHELDNTDLRTNWSVRMSRIKQIRLGAQHKPTGNTRHYIAGRLMSPPASLSIEQFPGEPGYYLLYFDSEGSELTDTYHESLDNAMAQAEFEFNVKPTEWNGSSDDQASV